MTDCQVCDNQDTQVLKCLRKMNNDPNYSVFPRIYVQFNELVFNGTNTVATADLSGDYKIETTEYPFKNGSYYSPSVHEGRLLMGEQDLSLDLTLPFAQLTRLQALDYDNFIKYNLSHAGKLWAFDTGGKLIWAFAIPKHPPYDDYEQRTGQFIGMSMDFLIPEGVWHTADTRNVFLQPYDMCEMKETFGTGKDHVCNAKGECENPSCDECCYRGEPFCETCWNPYDKCNNPYQITYNCYLGRQRNGWHSWGDMFKSDTDFIIGKVVSNGILRSPVSITLLGEFDNPRVTFRDVTIKLKGHYEGRIVFDQEGKVYYWPHGMCEDENPCPIDPLPLDKIEFTCLQIGFDADHGSNYLEVHYDNCPVVYNFAYVYVDELLP